MERKRHEKLENDQWRLLNFFNRQCVELWLERTPGLDENGFNFPAKYKAAVEAIFKHELEIIEV